MNHSHIYLLKYEVKSNNWEKRKIKNCPKLRLEQSRKYWKNDTFKIKVRRKKRKDW